MTHQARGYVVALAATLAALALRLLLAGWLQDDAPTLVFTLSVTLAALYGGFRPGMFATLLGAGAAAALFIAPFLGTTRTLSSGLLQIFLFVMIGLVISVLGQALQNAQRRVASSEEYLARILETTASGILVLDCDGYITFANPAAAHLFGLTPSHMIGRPHDDAGWGIATPAGKPIPSDELPFPQALRQKKKVDGYRMSIRGPDDKAIPLSVNAAVLHDKGNLPSGVVLALNQISGKR